MRQLEGPPPLQTLQRQMLAALRGQPSMVECGIVGDGRLDAAGRVGVYADMYEWRLLDVLRGVFPKILAVLGDEGFAALARAYVQACPSRHPSLRQLGDRMAAFLAGSERPAWLGDLAALEWARHDVFDARDADALTLGDLQTFAPEAFASLPVRLVPAHRTVEAKHCVETVWRAASRGEEVTAPAAGERTLVVFRQGASVFHRVASPLERQVLPLAAAGTTFGELCEAIAARAPDGDAATRAAFELLACWVGDGLLANPGVS